jgi:hypothetical protein
MPRLKWIAGKAPKGNLSELIGERRATWFSAHFNRNPLGHVQLTLFPHCSHDLYQPRYGCFAYASKNH